MAPQDPSDVRGGRDGLQEVQVGEAEEGRVRAVDEVGVHDGAMECEEVRARGPASWVEADERSMGVLFGGVSDEDKDEETLDSTFYNELCVPFRLAFSLSLD